MPLTAPEVRDPAAPAASSTASSASTASPAKRRLAFQHVREARDRLTSTSGTRPVFDYELLRQFAQNRLSASAVILLLIVTIGLFSGLWTGAIISGVWTVGTVVIHLIITRTCRQFLA
jgi:two-component system, cell cycle sensor histidine kinase PleC